MLSQVGCAEEDAEVDAQLGYPPVYAKLCRHEPDAAGLPMPFTEGPPQAFLPYAPHAEDFQHSKDWDSFFPVVAERDRDSSDTRKFAEELWQQLDHLGNAGFDPSKFRVDPYGNVVYRNADPSSPLAWDIDHWFPSSRGGKTRLPNLRIVQWQAYLRKRNRLEFLVSWWDLQHGCSINQFLSAFAAKNADFRKRSFALFFQGGEDESVAREHVGECRPWPQHFREKKALCGLAAAAIVSVAKHNVADCKSRVSYSHSSKETPSKRHWSGEEEEAIRRGVRKFGPRSWREINEDDPDLANRSASQIKDKVRSMRAVARNNNGASSTGTGKTSLLGRQSAATTALQKELRVKIMREEERREREEELAQVEETVVKLKVENEKERVRGSELESLVKKSKHCVEKHRKLAESQSSYRLCLERVLRDTMHQAMSYKEQARITQEACNVLIARLDCQRATCEAIETDLLQRHSKREALDGAVPAGGSTAAKVKGTMQGRTLVDVSSCVSLHDDDDEEDGEEIEDEQTVHLVKGSVLTDSDTDHDCGLGVPQHDQLGHARKTLVRHAIKVAMQVGDETKGAVGMWPSLEALPVEGKVPTCLQSSAECIPDSRTEIRKCEEIAGAPHHQHYVDADNETEESASDSGFADDEMSPAILISTENACRLNDSKLVKFHGSSSALRDCCTRKSKPGPDSSDEFAFDLGQLLIPDPALDTPIASAGDSSSQSGSRREVQKDVIVMQTESSAGAAKFYKSEDTASTLYKHETYLDEILQQVRFQTPTAELNRPATADTSPKLSGGHLDHLLEQMLATHLDSMRRNEARHRQSVTFTDHNEKMREMGKSNLDKWLQALLIKDDTSSPGLDSSPLQLHSPGLSQKTVESAMRRSLEHQEFVTSRDGDAGERPKSLWGALLRKLSVKQQSDQDILRLDSQETAQEADLKLTSSKNESQTTTDQRNNKGFIYSASTTMDHALFGWETERRVGADTLEFTFSDQKLNGTTLPCPLFNVDEEASETESGENANRASSKPRQSVSDKVAGFVGWKKSSKKVDTRSQAEPAAATQMD